MIRNISEVPAAAPQVQAGSWSLWHLFGYKTAAPAALTSKVSLSKGSPQVKKIAESYLLSKTAKPALNLSYCQNLTSLMEIAKYTKDLCEINLKWPLSIPKLSFKPCQP